MATNYVVEQGDCISSIAFQHGFFPDTIWNHPNNAELKKKRKNLNVLIPGDVVYIPDKRLKEVNEPTNEVHKFRYKSTPAKLRIQFMAEGKPRANTPYSLNIDGKVISDPKARTDSQGFVDCSISPLAKQGVLLLGEGETQTEFILQLGNLNPVSDLTGVKQRLRNLGLYNGRIDQDFNEATKDSIRTFQASSGLTATGELDEATRSKLEQIHDA